MVLRPSDAEIEQNSNDRKRKKKYKGEHVAAACSLKGCTGGGNEGSPHEIKIADAEIGGKVLFAVKGEREGRGDRGGGSVGKSR